MAENDPKPPDITNDRLAGGLRFVATAALGAGAWELFVSQIVLYTPNSLRAVMAGLVYAFVWEALLRWTKCRSLRRMVLLGAVSPYIAILATVVGYWIIFVAIWHWWIFVPVGVVTALTTHLLRLVVR